MRQFYQEFLEHREWMRGVASVTIEFEYKNRQLMMLEMQIRETEEELTEKQKEAEELRQWLKETEEALK